MTQPNANPLSSSAPTPLWQHNAVADNGNPFRSQSADDVVTTSPSFLLNTTSTNTNTLTMTINHPIDPSHAFINTIASILRGLCDDNGFTPEQLASIYVGPFADNQMSPLHGNTAVNIAITTLVEASNRDGPIADHQGNTAVTTSIRTLAGAFPHANPEPPPTGSTEAAPIHITDSPTTNPTMVSPTPPHFKRPRNDGIPSLTFPDSATSAVKPRSLINTETPIDERKPAARATRPARTTGPLRHHPPLPNTNLAGPHATGTDPLARQNTRGPPQHPQNTPQTTGINPNMYATPATPPALHPTLPTNINVANLSTNRDCRSFDIPLIESSIAAIQRHWKAENRVQPLLDSFPQQPLTASPPVLAAASAIWLLNASTATITACLTANAIPLYTTRHLQRPISYTYANINETLPPGFVCERKHLTVDHLLNPFAHEPEVTHHGLPWYTYPIVAELTVPARKTESTEECNHITGYAIFHNQCRAVIAVNNNPSYTFIGNKVRENLNFSLLACKIFPIHNNRNNINSGALRILTAFTVIPTFPTHHAAGENRE